MSGSGFHTSLPLSLAKDMNVDIVIFVFRAISWACSMGSTECQAQAGDLFSLWMEADSPDTSQDNP